MGSKGGLGASYQQKFSPHERVEISGKVEASVDFALGVGLLGAAVKFDPSTWDVTLSASGGGGIGNLKVGFWSGTLSTSYGAGTIIGAKAGAVGAYAKAEIVYAREVTGVDFLDPLNTSNWKTNASIDAKVKGGFLTGSADVGISVDFDREKCFLAGTPIDMWDGTQKPIEYIKPGDVVLSYDADGTLKPGKVKRTFENRVRHVLDVHGLMVTPGHATLCGDGKFKGRHVPMIDILRSDGALVAKNGSLIRAATNCPVGSMGDRKVPAVAVRREADGSVSVSDRGEIRLGTRFITADGADLSVLDLISSMGAAINQDGYLQGGPFGTNQSLFVWEHSDFLPKPEDYILQRSQLTLVDIYEADEWENVVGPQLSPPFAGEAGPSYARPQGSLQAPGWDDGRPPNVPLSMRGSPNQPTMSRKQRRAFEAKQRKRTKAATNLA